MKKSVLVLFLFVSIISSYKLVNAQELQAQSRINQVTIFSGDALVDRVSELKLDSKELTAVVFADIIPDLDDNSLRVSGSGSAQVKILGAKVVTQFLEDAAQAKVKQLQGAIQDIRDEKTKLANIKSVLAEEKSFLDSIRLFSHEQLPKDLVTKMPATKDLEDTLKFLNLKLTDNFSQGVEIDFKTRDLNKKEEALNRELSGLFGVAKKQKKSIVVELEVLKPGDLNLALSYMVRGASWYPLYDARVNFDKSEVELVQQAVARQNTGDNWEDVQVSLSTAKVNISARMPEVESWFIRPFQPRKYEAKEKAFPQSSRKMMSRADVADAQNGIGALVLDKFAVPVTQEAEYQYAQTQEKGVSVVYQIKRRSQIKSDGSEYKLPISVQLLKSEFEYSCYPRLSNYAYLRSKVTNANDLQLLGGRVNIFLDGGFVGSSSIDNIGPGEEFDLYLGVDENVKVKRELVEKKVDDILLAGIPSPNRKTSFKYKLSVENYKNKKIKVNIFENIPVSQDEKIKVNLGQISLTPKEKEWKDKKGVWRWELELEPKAKQEIFIFYSVEHPRNLEVEGL
ncbi:MAG: mucoidy inhibitor MuiA family protein [Candidatus Omnitrophica bacterium]|nr:mucoidy inhibitor MuiA family protein [Candidatus Omnitrophota bacterium]MBU1923630.1 mucoidy inhibitor MuiA family protein [Candidatus Omnitrophota bacterium]